MRRRERRKVTRQAAVVLFVAAVAVRLPPIFPELLRMGLALWMVDRGFVILWLGRR